MGLSEHLEKLRHFRNLAAHRSISECAKATGLSQAGLSKSLALLEDVLGAPLFVRSAQGLVLTKEGELTLQSSQAILAEAERLESTLRSSKASRAPERLSIGMYDSIAVYFFDELTEYLETIYPNVMMSLLVDASARLSEAARRGDVDLAIGVNLELDRPRGCEHFPLFEDHYSFYVSTRWPPKGLAPLLLHPTARDSKGRTIEEVLGSLVRRHGAHRAFNFETLKALTLQGRGIGVLPTRVARPFVLGGQLQEHALPKTPRLFGLHQVGFLATESFLRGHRDFAMDLHRLGERWSQRV